MVGDPLLMELWRRAAGLPEELPPLPQRMPPLSELRETEWSSLFETLMRNRLLMGAFRYGRLNAIGKTRWNRMARVITEAQAYLEDGNDERLVDIANMALLEFEEGVNPKKHFNSRDDVGHNSAL